MLPPETQAFQNLAQLPLHFVSLMVAGLIGFSLLVSCNLSEAALVWQVQRCHLLVV